VALDRATPTRGCDGHPVMAARTKTAHNKANAETGAGGCRARSRRGESAAGCDSTPTLGVRADSGRGRALRVRATSEDRRAVERPEALVVTGCSVCVRRCPVGRNRLSLVRRGAQVGRQKGNPTSGVSFRLGDARRNCCPFVTGPIFRSPEPFPPVSACSEIGVGGMTQTWRAMRISLAPALRGRSCATGRRQHSRNVMIIELHPAHVSFRGIVAPT
jgi:hypothetical protein